MTTRPDSPRGVSSTADSTPRPDSAQTPRPDPSLDVDNTDNSDPTPEHGSDAPGRWFERDGSIPSNRCCHSYFRCSAGDHGDRRGRSGSGLLLLGASELVIGLMVIAWQVATAALGVLMIGFVALSLASRRDRERQLDHSRSPTAAAEAVEAELLLRGGGSTNQLRFRVADSRDGPDRQPRVSSRGRRRCRWCRKGRSPGMVHPGRVENDAEVAAVRLTSFGVASTQVAYPVVQMAD